MDKSPINISTHRSLFRNSVTAAVVIGIGLIIPSAGASVTSKTVSPGVMLTEEIDDNPAEIIHVLSIDLTQANNHVEIIPGQDTITGPTGDIHLGREDVREIAVRHHAVAAVNGDYFPFTGDPYGAAVWNGNLFSEPYPGRTVMGIEADGRSVLFDILGFLGELQNEQNQLTAITGIDRMVSATDTNDLVLFTPTYGPRSGIRPGCVEAVLTGVNLPLKPSKLLTGTVSAINSSSKVGSNIPDDGVIIAALPGGQAADYLLNKLHVGERAELVCAVAPPAVLTDAVKLALVSPGTATATDAALSDLNPAALTWGSVSEVVGGGPRLIVDGKIQIDGSQEGFNDSFVGEPNPRTAVGVTRDGKLLLVTVDGRQLLSKGVSLADLAKILQRYGACNAMNLDGGGSTTMAVDGMLVNSIASSDGERPVAEGLCVINNTSSAVNASEIAANSATVGRQADAVPESLPIAIGGVPAVLAVGQTAKLSIGNGGTRISGDDQSIIWGGAVGPGIAFVNQSGVVKGIQPGTGILYASYKGQSIQIPLTVGSTADAGKAALLSGEITTPNSRHPLQTTLVVGAFTSTDMPLPNMVIHLDVKGGSAVSDDLTTNVDGYAQTNVTWTGRTGSVVLKANGIMPRIVNQP